MEKLEKKILLARIEPETAIREIGDFVVRKVLDRKQTGCVIGLSGGVDSTVTALIIKDAFDRYNSSQNSSLQKSGQTPNLNLELVGYILPTKINNPKDTEDGIYVANKLGLRYEICSLEALVDAARTTNKEAFQKNVDRGNMISRLRAVVLNTKGSTENKMVAGTGNRDEDFGIGYYTLFGDGAVHLSPIGGLPKRCVRDIAEYKGFGAIARKASTPGLEPNQTSFGDIGYSYDFMVDIVMEGLNQGFSPDELYKHSQVISQAKKEISDYQRMFGFKKFNSERDLISDLLRRHYESALPKSEIVHPEIAKVTLIYDKNGMGD